MWLANAQKDIFANKIIINPKSDKMKKVYVLLMVMVLAVSVSAQNVIQTRDANKIKAMPKIMQAVKAPTDTIFIYEYFGAATANYNYTAPGAGYILGTWWDAGVAQSTKVAQGYVNVDAWNIEGVLIWAGYKYKNSSAGASLGVTMHKVDDSSHYGGGGVNYDIACPGTQLGTMTIPWADIDTSAGAWAHGNFGAPVPIVGVDFAMVLDFADFYAKNDTLSIVGGDGAASGVYGMEYTWYYYPTGGAGDFWTQFSHVWTSGGNPIDAAITIFPVAEDASGIIENNGFVNGLKLGQNYPNPSVDGNTYVDYAIAKGGDVSITVYDFNGKTIDVINEGNKAAGQYTVKIGTELSAGVYYYTLTSNGQRLTKKMIIE